MARQERAVRTREALVRSASEVFDREGFTVASLTSISTRAGVSNGALHFHFASKAALAEAVEDAALARLREVAGRSPSGLSPSPLQCLVDATHALARALDADVVLRAGFALCADAAHASTADLRGHWRDWVEQVVAQARDRGELRADVDPRDVTSTVVAAMVGFEVLGAGQPHWLAPRTVTRFWRLLLPATTSREARVRAEGSPAPPA
jgi:AcrR family transcriptional regulator